MKHITHGMAAAAINELDSPFDAHMVERRMLRLHTVAMAEELLEYRHTDTLHQFSATFARWLDSDFAGQIRKTRKVHSDNLGGRANSNQEWEKLTVPIT